MAIAVPNIRSQQTLRLSFRYAYRELRSGFSGFTGFLICLALGVGGIATVGSFAQAVRGGLVEQGQVLLGGDVEFSLTHRQVSVRERAAFKKHGVLSESATLRAMVTVPERGTQSLIELKAVDEAYPLYGTLVFEDKTASRKKNDTQPNLPDVSVDSSLLQSLNINLGDEIKIGNQLFNVKKILTVEPDRISSGFMVGPRVLMSRASLDKTGLIQPGSLMHWRYKIRLLKPGSKAIKNTISDIKKEFPKANWQIRTRNNAVPGINHFVDNLTVFLTLVGFTTLLVGGVGIANSVKAYVDARRSVIATYKCLGATGNFITKVYLIQMMMVAGVGITIGIIAGALIPLISLAVVGSLLPVPAKVGIFIEPLALSALYGLLVTFAFAIWPLGRVRLIAPSALFRDLVTKSKHSLNYTTILLFFVTCLVLALVLVLTSNDRLISAWFAAGATVGFATLGLAAVALTAVLKRLPRFKLLELRIAISNLHRPGAATISAVLSLGLGLTLVVTLMLIDKNLVRQLREDMPDKAPSFFFVDIQKAQIKPFEAVVQKETGLSDYTKVPMLRGRIIRLKNVDVDKIDPPAGARWVLQGDRGITYSETLPKGSALVTGKWWPPAYSGPPLVSFTHDLATLLGLSVGDTITVNVLGRNITAKIANTRAVKWRSFGINFVMVFTPDTLKQAPLSYLASVTLPKQKELKLLKSVSSNFANITSIRVRDVLEAINALLGKLIVAIRAASGLAFFAAIVVLAGAIAAGRRQRTYDAAILKTLGATRKMLLRCYCLEFGILGLFSSVFAVLAGTIAAYLVVEYVLDVRFVFFPGMAIATTLLAVLGTLVAGLVSSWRILGNKPAAILRSQS